MFCLIGVSVQVKVADALKKRAPDTKPDFFINVGDNFYWGGVNTVTQFHYVPLCSTMFHYVPLWSTMVHYGPLWSTLFDYVPPCSTVFYYVPLGFRQDC